MKNKHYIQFITFFFMSCLLNFPQLHSHAEEPIGTPFDLQGFIDKEIKAGKKQIVIPPGKYRVTPQNRVHLNLRDVKDLEIIADQTEMICTETAAAMNLANCQNVKIRGLTIDYDPLPFTQGKIMALAPDKKWIDIELFPGYPENKILPFKLEIFEPKRTFCEPKITTDILLKNKRPANTGLTKTTITGMIQQSI